MHSCFSVNHDNVSDRRRCKEKWTTQINWQHKVNKTKTNKRKQWLRTPGQLFYIIMYDNRMLSMMYFMSET
jgi:hypothetical protein